MVKAARRKAFGGSDSPRKPFPSARPKLRHHRTSGCINRVMTCNSDSFWPPVPRAFRLQRLFPLRPSRRKRIATIHSNGSQRGSRVLRGFHAFGQRLHVQIARQGDDGGDDGGVVAVVLSLFRALEFGFLPVMTVHGAKGLQAPIVILPDTCSAHRGDRDGPAGAEARAQAA